MDVRDLARRIDEETAQLHARIDDIAATQNRRAAKQSEAFNALRDEQREAIHDIKNAVQGFRLRLESLEAHPPVITEPDDQHDYDPNTHP